MRATVRACPSYRREAKLDFKSRKVARAARLAVNAKNKGFGTLPFVLGAPVLIAISYSMAKMFT